MGNLYNSQQLLHLKEAKFCSNAFNTPQEVVLREKTQVWRHLFSEWCVFQKMFKNIFLRLTQCQVRCFRGSCEEDKYIHIYVVCVISALQYTVSSLMFSSSSVIIAQSKKACGGGTTLLTLSQSHCRFQAFEMFKKYNVLTVLWRHYAYYCSLCTWARKKSHCYSSEQSSQSLLGQTISS